MDLVNLLADARAAGLTVTSDGNHLIIRGPKSAEPFALRLLDHKAEVLSLLAPISIPESKVDDRLTLPMAAQWGQILLVWPASSTVALPRRQWLTLDDGSVLARYTREELRLALALAGVDVAEVDRKTADLARMGQ